MERRDASEEPGVPGIPHEWIYFRLGRACWQCSIAQPKGEFDDDVPCAAPAVHADIWRSLSSRLQSPGS